MTHQWLPPWRSMNWEDRVSLATVAAAVALLFAAAVWPDGREILTGLILAALFFVICRTVTTSWEPISRRWRDKWWVRGFTTLVSAAWVWWTVDAIQLVDLGPMAWRYPLVAGALYGLAWWGWAYTRQLRRDRDARHCTCHRDPGACPIHGGQPA